MWEHVEDGTDSVLFARKHLCLCSFLKYICIYLLFVCVECTLIH